MDQKPSIGRIVHYVSYGTPNGEYRSVCRAAIIAEVKDEDETCSLVIMNPEGLFFHDCKHDEAVETDTEKHNPAGGTWHWPEKV